MNGICRFYDQIITAGLKLTKPHASFHKFVQKVCFPELDSGSKQPYTEPHDILGPQLKPREPSSFQQQIQGSIPGFNSGVQSALLRGQSAGVKKKHSILSTRLAQAASLWSPSRSTQKSRLRPCT